MRDQKFVQMVLVTWPRWQPHPYMVKASKKLLQNGLTADSETWYTPWSLQSWYNGKLNHEDYMYQRSRSSFIFFQGHSDVINIKQLLFQSHWPDWNQISYGASSWAYSADLTWLFDLTSLHISDFDEVMRARSSLIAPKNISLESPINVTLSLKGHLRH